MRRLSSVDAQFLAMEDGRTHAHVCQLTILEGTATDGSPVDLDRIRAVIADRLHLMPPFRWKLRPVPFGLDYPVMVPDPDFDLDSHLWEVALPGPGSDDQLGELVARIASRPLDRARPLWELHVVHGLAEGRVALLTKVHHAVVDGVSGVELLSTLLDLTPEVAEVEPDGDPPAPAESPSDLSLLVRGLGSVPRQPVRMLRALPTTLRHLDQLPTMRNLPGSGALSTAADRAYRAVTRGKDGDLVERAEARAPKVSINGRISAHRRFAFGSLDLAAVKAVKEQVPGTTVNDVVVALCAGALRRRLEARGDKVTEPLVAMVPISVRERGADQYGNHISAMIVPIPTDQAEPLARVKAAHEVLSSAKTRHRAMPATLLQDANHTVPPALFVRTARAIATTTANGWVDPPFNVTISNIPGSRVPLYCAGAKVVAQHPVNVLIEGLGLSVTLLSYEDRLDFGLTADRELVPDVGDLSNELVEELDAMTQAFGVATTRRRTRRRS